MNLEIEKIFAEIGRLHMHVALLSEQLAQAQADLAAKQIVQKTDKSCST